MFLYELAIEVGKHSSEVAEAARGIGLVDAGPATDLTRDQVIQVRAALGVGGAPPPLPPPPPPLSAEPWSEGTPASAAPLPPSDPWAGADEAPPVAPPTPSGLQPPPPPPSAASWAPGEPPAPEVPETSEVATGPAFVPPPAFEAPAAPPSASEPPPPPPPPPGPPTGGPVAEGPVVDPDARSGFGAGQLVVLWALGIAVLALFCFMIVNSGPDEERAEAIAAAEPIDPAAERRAAEEKAGIETTTTVPAETTTTAAAAPDAYAPLDLDAFCRGGRAFGEVAAGMGEAFVTEDIPTMRAWIADHRGEWDDSLSTLAAGAPPINADDLLAFRTTWDGAFDAVNAHSTYEAANGAVDGLDLARANARFDEVAELVAFHCR